MTESYKETVRSHFFSLIRKRTVVKGSGSPWRNPWKKLIIRNMKYIVSLLTHSLAASIISSRVSAKGIWVLWEMYSVTKEQDWALIIQENETLRRLSLPFLEAGFPSRIYMKVLGTSLFVLLTEKALYFCQVGFSLLFSILSPNLRVRVEKKKKRKEKKTQSVPYLAS